MLVVLCLAVSVTEVDATIVNVALPSLAQALSTTSTELVWVVDAFMLTFAGFLLIAGRLGDQYGHQRVLQGSVALFGVSSVFAAFAANTAELIFWRALLGLGAAGILPASLALITVSFPSSERCRALGIWTAMTGLALPLGPIIGGWLLEYFWWGSIFLVNVPIAVVVLIGNFRIIVEPGGRAERGQWDILGLVLSTAGVTTLLCGLIEGPQCGWTNPGILGAFIAGIALLGGFLARQRRAESPILDLRLLRLRNFTTGTAVNLLILFVLSGVLFVLTQYLQSARGYSPLQAGLAMAPLAAAVTVASVLSGAVVAWIGARATVTTGLLLIASGTLALATAGLDTGYLHIGLGLAAIGFGTGLGTAPAITITLSEVPSDLAGVSSAVANSARQFGGALGVAVLGSILITQYVKNLAPDVEKFPQPLIHEAEKSISAAIQFATTLDRIQAAEFLNLTVRSFVKAMHVTATIAAVTCILGAGAALALLPRGNVRRWWGTAPGALLVVALALSCGQEAVTAPLPSASGSFLLTATDTGGDYAPTFTGNGYLGVRVPPAGQGYAGGAVPAQSEVAGFYAQSAGQVQQRANVPTWSTLTFTDGGQDFSPGAGQVTGWRQQLNLQDGSITTTARWRAPNGHLTDLRYVVFTDRARPHLAIVRLELTPRWTGTATVTDLIDGAPATATTLVAKGWNAEDHQLWETVRTQGLGVVAGLASQVRVSPNVPSVTDTPVGNGADQTVGQRLVFPVTGNRTVTLTKYVGVSTSHDAAAPESAARRYAWAAAAVGFDDLLAENTAAWAALWAGRVEVLGNPTLATEVNASEFYLWSSTRAGLSWSVSPAGLSSNGYDGHIFWDAETWMYPTLLAQHPDLAAGMNDYRYQRLDAATAHAHGTGFSGARFPWESAEDGTEQIPPPTSVNSEGIYEQHITADVALAQWQYYLATGDHGWLVTRGWPILSRAATFWASRVTPGVGGSYHINNVTGPDEENPDVNDEAYTTVAAATTLRIATRAAQIVGDTAPRSWATIADGLAPLADPSLGMHSEFAGYQGQLIKQADVTMLQYPWRYPMPAATARRDIDYYVPRSDPGGPSMDDAINAIDTAALGSAGCASFVYTQRSIAPFMRDAFDQFSETRTGGAFTFMTGIGGFLQEFLYGYSGLRWNDDAVRLDPSLTGQLDGVVLHGLAWHGRRFTVAIGAGTTLVSLDSGAPLPVAVGGSTRTVTPGHPLIVPTRRPDRTPTDDLARCQAAQASSSAPGADPLAAGDGSPATGWQPQQTTASLSVPLVHEATITRVTVDWGQQWPPAPTPNVPSPPGLARTLRATDYDLVVSRDGRNWTVLTQVRGRTSGTRDELRFAPVRARFVGLRITAATNQTPPVLTNLTVPNS